MDLEEFYKKVCELLPYKEGKECDFYKRLSKALDTYIDCLKKYNNGTVREVIYICNKLKEIVRNSLKGLHVTSAAQLKFLLQGKIGTNPKINLFDLKTIHTIEAGNDFYRIRKLPSVYNVDAKELFHIPINKRGIVKTQRYSIPGYPCLYLGKSIYGCWEELHRPHMHECAVSRFQNTKTLNLIDLSIAEKERLKLPDTQKLIPLIIVCMIPVSNDSDTYKPEYIVPQLIFELLIKNRKIGNTIIHGIEYTSTHTNTEFDFPNDTFTNYAIPVVDINGDNQYCKELCSAFQLTLPTTNEIEKLKIGYGVVCENVDKEGLEKKRENYKASDFGCLEERLNKFPLHTIS